MWSNKKNLQEIMKYDYDMETRAKVAVIKLYSMITNINAFFDHFIQVITQVPN